MEIVYISSDRDLDSFESYFGKMPWTAIPTDAEAAKTKQALATAMKVRGIPSLIALDVVTGHFITDGARDGVMRAGKDDVKRKELINSWKNKEAVPIEQAKFGQSAAGVFSFEAIVGLLLKNPIYVFALLYFFSKIWKTLSKALKNAADEYDDEQPVGVDEEADTLTEETSEF